MDELNAFIEAVNTYYLEEPGQKCREETNALWDYMDLEGLKDSELFEDLDIDPMIITIFKEIYFSNPVCSALYLWKNLINYKDK